MLDLHLRSLVSYMGVADIQTVKKNCVIVIFLAVASGIDLLAVASSIFFGCGFQYWFARVFLNAF